MSWTSAFFCLPGRVVARRGAGCLVRAGARALAGGGCRGGGTGRVWSRRRSVHLLVALNGLRVEGFRSTTDRGTRTGRARHLEHTPRCPRRNDHLRDQTLPAPPQQPLGKGRKAVSAHRGPRQPACQGPGHRRQAPHRHAQPTRVGRRGAHSPRRHVGRRCRRPVAVRLPAGCASTRCGSRSSGTRLAIGSSGFGSGGCRSRTGRAGLQIAWSGWRNGLRPIGNRLEPGCRSARIGLPIGLPRIVNRVEAN